MLHGFFDIQNTFITIHGYQMSYLEFLGTILNLWSVWLVAHKRILTWPIGNLGVVLFGVLFYQVQLYSDVLLQFYFLITGFYGWWIWSKEIRHAPQSTPNTFLITRCSRFARLTTLAFILSGTLAIGFFMSRIHQMIPKLFPQPAAYPYLDAFCSTASVAATILMAHKKLENWYLWLAVDIVSIGLYATKDVLLVACLYLVFLGLALNGLLNWSRSMRALEPA
jgi:nicotinamide mononucleotide transporter